MIAKVSSYALNGIEAYPIEIEVDIANGLPAVAVIGLADTAVKESKERVKSAIKNSGFKWPPARITISLAPSNIKKEGSSFDLPIALGILAASEQMSGAGLENFSMLGELSLDGSLRPSKGILPICICLSKNKNNRLLIPHQNVKEAALVSDLNIFPLKSLKEGIEVLNSPELFTPYKIDRKDCLPQNSYYPVDFSEVKGQYFAKRALEIAVSGMHNILFLGPPGSGKTMLAKRVPTIMPDLSLEEILEITKIHSVAGMLLDQAGLITQRPFRMPHHTISDAALVGGGAIPIPGEISLAHQGILFLDELPEFDRNCLEALRQPLEDGLIHIARVNKSFAFPASFMLVAAMNPCKCGKLNDRKSSCRCSTNEVYKYRSKISGPLLDRIDIHIEVPASKYQELSSNLPAENSAEIKKRVDAARAIQRERFKNEGILCNALMNHKQIRQFCVLGKKENELLRMAITEFNFSGRAYDKILKVSRTIADLSGCETIQEEHVSEAIQYRSLDREFFL